MIHSDSTAPSAPSQGAQRRPQFLSDVFLPSEFDELVGSELAQLTERSLKAFQSPATHDHYEVVEENARRVAFFLASKLPPKLVQLFTPEEFVVFCSPVLDDFRRHHWLWLADQAQDPMQPQSRPQYMVRLRQFVTRHGWIAGQRLKNVFEQSGQSLTPVLASGQEFSVCAFLSNYLTLLERHIAAAAREVTASPAALYRPIVHRHLTLARSELLHVMGQKLADLQASEVLPLVGQVLSAIFQIDLTDRTATWRQATTAPQKEEPKMTATKQVTPQHAVMAYSHHIAANARDIVAANPKFKHYSAKMKNELMHQVLRYRTAATHWFFLTYGAEVSYPKMLEILRTIDRVTMAYVCNDTRVLPFKRIPANMLRNISNEPTAVFEFTMQGQKLFETVVLEQAEIDAESLIQECHTSFGRPEETVQRLAERLEQYSTKYLHMLMQADPTINASFAEIAVRAARNFIRTALAEKTGVELPVVENIDYSSDTLPVQPPKATKETAMLTTAQQATLITNDDVVATLLTQIREDLLAIVRTSMAPNEGERAAYALQLDELLTARKQHVIELIRGKFETASEEVINQIYQENVVSQVNAAFEAAAQAEAITEEAVVESTSLFSRLKAGVSHKLATVKAYANSFIKKPAQEEAEEVAQERKPMSRKAKVAVAGAAALAVGLIAVAVVSPETLPEAASATVAFILVGYNAVKDVLASALSTIAGLFSKTAEAAGEAAETIGEAAAA